MTLWSIWWVWLAGALALAILETLLPGFIFLGFAIGAALVGVGLLILGPATSLPLLLLVFALLSLAAWLAMRHYFKLPEGQTKIIHHDIND